MAPVPARYTHGHHESVLRSHRWRTAENSAAYLLAAPPAGPGAARRRLRAGHDHTRPRGARGAGPHPWHRRLGRRHRAGASGGGDGRGLRDLGRAFASRGVRRGRRLPPRHRRRVGGRGARAPGAAAPPCADRCTAGVAPRHPPGRHRGCSRRGLRRDDLVPRRAAPRPVARCSTAPSLAGTAASPTPAATCWLGPTRPASTTSRPPRRPGASPRRRTGPGGPRRGPNASSASALADQLLSAGLADRAELDAIAAAWRAWADEPDGWFSVLHGEIVCRVP